MLQSRAKTLGLGIPRTFPDIKPMDEESVADICRVLRSIEPMVAHQHMKAVNTAREECDAPRITGEFPAGAPTGSFDRWHREWPTPTRPPSVSRVKPLDQHRARLTLDSEPRLSVHCGERKTRG